MRIIQIAQKIKPNQKESPPEGTLFYASPSKQLEHAWAFRFYRTEGDNWIATPNSGGFAVRIPSSDVLLVGPEAEEYFKKEETKPLLKGNFTIDSGEEGIDIPEQGLKPGDTVQRFSKPEDTHSFEGYYDPNQSWNGWRVPYFDQNEIKKFASLCKKLGGKVSLNGNQLSITLSQEDSSPTVLTSKKMNTIDGPKQLWDVSLGLCWSLEEAPEPPALTTDSILDAFNNKQINKKQLDDLMRQMKSAKNRTDRKTYARVI